MWLCALDDACSVLVGVDAIDDHGKVGAVVGAKQPQQTRVTVMERRLCVHVCVRLLCSLGSVGGVPYHGVEEVCDELGAAMLASLSFAECSHGVAHAWHHTGSS